MTYPWRDEFLTPGLRWVQSISVGVEQFPIERFRDAGVVLTSARGIHGPQVAEHALALLLAMTRGIGKAALQQRDHEWEWPPVTEIGGMTMGVIGLGSIGEAIAQRASALGMRVIGTKRDIRGYDGVCRRGDSRRADGRRVRCLRRRGDHAAGWRGNAGHRWRAAVGRSR